MLRPIFLAARLFTGVAREKNLSAINYPPRRPPAWGARIFAAMHVLAFRVLRFWLLLNSAR
jgi:hypothetical protein